MSCEIFSFRTFSLGKYSNSGRSSNDILSISFPLIRHLATKLLWIYTVFIPLVNRKVLGYQKCVKTYSVSCYILLLSCNEKSWISRLRRQLLIIQTEIQPSATRVWTWARTKPCLLSNHANFCFLFHITVLISTKPDIRRCVIGSKWMKKIGVLWKQNTIKIYWYSDLVIKDDVTNIWLMWRS